MSLLVIISALVIVEGNAMWRVEDFHTHWLPTVNREVGHFSVGKYQIVGYKATGAPKCVKVADYSVWWDSKSKSWVVAHKGKIIRCRSLSEVESRIKWPYEHDSEFERFVKRRCDSQNNTADTTNRARATGGLKPRPTPAQQILAQLPQVMNASLALTIIGAMFLFFMLLGSTRMW